MIRLVSDKTMMVKPPGGSIVRLGQVLNIQYPGGQCKPRGGDFGEWGEGAEGIDQDSFFKS